MSFSGSIKNFTLKHGLAVNAIVRETTTTLFARIVTETPVDTGAAKGNWRASVGAPENGTTDRLDPGGAMAMAEIEAKTPQEAGHEVFISNSLPYIESLERGHSQQAPAGFVRANMDRAPKIVEAIARKHRV